MPNIQPKASSLGQTRAGASLPDRTLSILLCVVLLIATGTSQAQIPGPAQSRVPAVGGDDGQGTGQNANVVQFRASATYSDNVARQGETASSDTISAVGMWVDWQRAGTRLDAYLRGSVDYNIYSNDSFDNELFAIMAGEANFQIIPRTLTWVLQDNFGKLRSDNFQVDVPSNRENINRLSTGPKFQFRFTSNTALEIGAYLRDTYFETSDFGNQVYSGTLSLIRALSANRSLSLNVVSDTTEYDNDEDYPSYDLQSASVTFSSRISRGEVLLSVGANRIEDDIDTSSGTLIDFDWRREISSTTQFSLGYDRRFSDAGDFYQRYQELENRLDLSSPFPGSNDPLEISSFNFGLQYAKGLANLGVATVIGDFDYQTANELDRAYQLLNVNFSYPLTPNWQLLLDGRFENSDYDNIDRDDKDYDYSGSLVRRITRTLSVLFRFRRLERDSTFDGASFDESRYSIEFTYSPRAQSTS